MRQPQFEDAHRCLNEAFSNLSRIVDLGDPEDRQQILRVMTLLANAGDELTILSRGQHRERKPD